MTSIRIEILADLKQYQSEITFPLQTLEFIYHQGVAHRNTMKWEKRSKSKQAAFSNSHSSEYHHALAER